MSHTHRDAPEAYLRLLAEGLGKCGIPVQIRRDADGRQYVRASHPKVPLSTDILCVQDADGTWTFTSEWGSAITPAADTVRAIEYIVTLLCVTRH